MGKDKNAQKPSAGHHGESFWKDQESKSSVGLALMQKMGWQKGAGLGKDGQGTAQYVKATQKKDNGGIGAKQNTTDETWLAATSLYNDLLARLNAEAKVTAAEKPREVDLSETAEDKSDNIVKRMDAATNGKKLYAKFKKGKDLGNFGAQDIAQILGKKKDVPRSASPTASESSDIVTTKASSNISDYFSSKAKAPEPRVVVQPISNDQGSSKLANLMNSRDRAAGFTEQFQVDYYNTMMGMSHSGRGGLGFGAPPPPQNTRMRFDTDSAPSAPPAAPRTNGTHSATNGFASASPLASAFSSASSGLGAGGSSMARSFDPYGHSDDEGDSNSKSKKDKSKRSNNAVPPPSDSPAPSSPANEDSVDVQQTESDEERAERKRKKKEAKRRARELAQAAEAEQEAAEVAEAIHDLEQNKSDKKKKKKRKEMDETEAAAEAPAAEEESEDERRKRRKAEKKARKLAEQEAEVAAAEESNGSKRKKSKKSVEPEEAPEEAPAVVEEESEGDQKKRKKKEKKSRE